MYKVKKKLKRKREREREREKKFDVTFKYVLELLYYALLHDILRIYG